MNSVDQGFSWRFYRKIHRIQDITDTCNSIQELLNFFSNTWSLFLFSTCVLPGPRVECRPNVFYREESRVASDALFMSVTPWALPNMYMHLTSQYPNSQKKPINFPKNTELWLSCNTKTVVKESTFLKQGLWKCFASYQWQDGAGLVPRNMIVPWFRGHREPNRPFCGCGFCFWFLLLSLSAYVWQLLQVACFTRRETTEEEGPDETAAVEQS